MSRPLKVGAVMYDPKVSVIWEIIRDFFDAQGAPINVAFYLTYEDQNDGLLSGAIDIAWNSPLAWVDAQRRSANGRLPRHRHARTRIAIASPTSWRGAAVRCRHSRT
jgi:ABC-type phosphate/phosphonate transport system substrate-binding protein